MPILAMEVEVTSTMPKASPSRRAVLKTLSLASAATFAPCRATTGQTREVPSPLHDPLRPAFHYLPARNWMNDPCGPIYFQGNYHLFHQYNPHAAVWGDMHWAHAISPDMIHWQRLPIALTPTPASADSEGCFTGTAVLDHGRPTFLYTGVQTVPPAEATLSDGTHNFRESQCLAVATDNSLNTWKKLPAPVIPSPPAGMKVTGFRDPSPWLDANTWYAVVGSGIAGKGGMVLLYRSPDLRAWEYVHPLIEGQWTGTPGPNPVDTGEMWECPDFFPLTDTATNTRKHVLIYSTEGKVLWNSGTFDSSTLLFHPEKSGELDYGRVGNERVTFYAPKTQLDAQGNRILWGWIAETRPEAEYSRAGWSGLMSLPRLLTLQDGELRMEPARQTARLRTPAVPGGAIHEVLAHLHHAPSSTPFALADASGPLLSIRSDPAQDPHTIHIAFGNGIPPITLPLSAPLPPAASVHAFIDNSVLELFIDRRICLTHRFYTRTAAAPIATIAFSGSYAIAEAQTFALKPIWPA